MKKIKPHFIENLLLTLLNSKKLLITHYFYQLTKDHCVRAVHHICMPVPYAQADIRQLLLQMG
jgi:hypothetical protein